MPTYEYVCSKCGHEFEVMQKMSDPPKKRCPVCAGKVERKIGGGAGLIFKGSGFYITDYRSGDYKAKEKAEKSETSGKPEKSDSAGKSEKAPVSPVAPVAPAKSKDSGGSSGGE